MLEIGGVETPYRNDSLSVTSALFIERPRVYLNDHNEARTLDDVGMLKEDFKMLEEKGIRQSGKESRLLLFCPDS